MYAKDFCTYSSFWPFSVRFVGRASSRKNFYILHLSRKDTLQKHTQDNFFLSSYCKFFHLFFDFAKKPQKAIFARRRRSCVCCCNRYECSLARFFALLAFTGRQYLDFCTDFWFGLEKNARQFSVNLENFDFVFLSRENQKQKQNTYNTKSTKPKCTNESVEVIRN